MTQDSLVWDSMSSDSSGSMPIGNGELGANVWVEPGALCMYLSRTDAWSENCRLLKLGKVRIEIAPNPFTEDTHFRQKLELRTGTIVIRAVKPEITVVVWVEHDADTLHVEVESETPVDVIAHLDIWRTAQRELTDRERFSAYGIAEGPDPVTVEPDTVVPSAESLVWYHRNERSIWADNLTHQGLADLAAPERDPLLHRTFGGMICCDGMTATDDRTLASSQPRTSWDIRVHTLSGRFDSADAWLAAVQEHAGTAASADLASKRTAHSKWWSEFWDRSYVDIAGSDEAEDVTRGYILQRWISACAGRGSYPIKFNGSIFTVDAREDDGNPENREFYDADYRRWGGGYWFQNTRLPYWPMVATGDFDLMRPFFRMFVDALPLALERTRTYFGHEGAFFPETMYFWGAYVNDNYGWNREGKHVSYVENTYIKWYWSGALELLAMALDYDATAGAPDFRTSTLLPLADGIITFFAQHWQDGPDGKIRFYPSASLETWHESIDPLPEIAGLEYVLGRLLALGSEAIGTSRLAAWASLRDRIPEIPLRDGASGTLIAPAVELLGPKRNSENPELYAVFPYRMYGVGKPDIELARRTYVEREEIGAFGWKQDDVQAAFLGLTDTAQEMVVNRARMKHEGSRFPAFWGPNMDWIPDQDHGGNLMMAVQTMLMQCDGKRILLFPAWPPEWNVRFKLHAPFGTTVEGELRDGAIRSLTVSPEERRADVELLIG